MTRLCRSGTACGEPEADAAKCVPARSAEFYVPRRVNAGRSLTISGYAEESFDAGHRFVNERAVERLIA
jgi:hypothetical protein